jgi:metal-sulfur cluster biosynthetic enzyme
MLDKVEFLDLGSTLPTMQLTVTITVGICKMAKNSYSYVLSLLEKAKRVSVCTVSLQLDLTDSPTIPLLVNMAPTSSFTTITNSSLAT